MMMKEEYVILVDEQDNAIGEMEKQAAHEENKKHRAFSVFLLDEQGRILLQKRAAGKYHSPNLWTNACCGHPRPDESTIDAAKRRTFEELGIQVEIEELFTLSYAEQLENGLWENEYDHVFVGKYTDPIERFNPDEVRAIKYVAAYELLDDLKLHPEQYTFWFKKIMPKLLPYLEKVD